MKRKLDPEDLKLWWLNTRDVTPLGKSLKKPKPICEGRPQLAAPQPALLRPTAQLAPQLNLQKRRQTLRKQAIEATLDLHGHTQELAWNRLHSFLLHCQGQGKRTVLVITGKGSLSSEQTLRIQVPRWLQESPLSRLILGYHVSLQQDGGTGAYYVYLKRRK